MIMPEYVHGSRAMWEQNLNGHIALDFQQKKRPYCMTMQDGSPTIRSYQVTEEGKVRNRWQMDNMDAPFVNVMPVDGPITRDGGACSYGSAELRDWMMEAANNDMCKAHVFVINTPGGSAWAINDFQQAVEYAHAHGQKVYAFIDGLCASAGMYLASVCDEVYYMHPKDMIGSIGVLACFYTEKNDTYNKYTNETYHEVYDPESYDKNKWYRDIAEDAKNDKELLDDLIKSGKEFRAAIKKAFPAATEKHIHGRMFEAEQVKGILCDGQMTLGEVVTRAFEVAGGSAQPIERITPVAPADDVPEEDPAPAAEEETTSKTNIEMKKYESIATACGVDELVVSEEGAHFVPQMLDTLDQTLNKQQSEKDAADEQLQTLQNQLSQAETQRNEAVAARERELKTSHEQALNTEREARQNVEQQLKEVKEQLATANQQLKDRDDQITALKGAPVPLQEGSPAKNGMDAVIHEPTCGMPAYDHNKSPMENARIRKEYMAKLGQ